MTKIFSAALLAATVLITGCATAPSSIQTAKDGSTHAYQFTSEKVRAGQKAQRFEVRAGDCFQDESARSDCNTDRERSELAVKDERYRIYPGGARWISWSTFIPEDYTPSTRVATTIGQIHQQGGLHAIAGGVNGYPPIIQFDTIGGTFGTTFHVLSGTLERGFDWGEFTPLSSLSKLKGKWTDFVVYFDSSKESGVMKIWMDGKLVQTIDKPITVEPREYYYFKYGVYRSFVSRNKGAMPTQVVFYDELRFGKTREEVDPSINAKLLPVD